MRSILRSSVFGLLWMASLLFLSPTDAQALNQARILAESSPPTSGAAGARVAVRVRVQNTGDTTWRAGDGYRLGAGSQNQVPWTAFSCGGYMNSTGDARAFLCRDVPPGGVYDFVFDVQLPASGSAQFAVRMVRDGVEWFGEAKSWSIAVSSAPGCARAALPTPSDRWKLEVFANRALDGSPVEERYDAAGAAGFAFDWGGGRASECTANDNFGIRFSRRIQIAEAGDYRFTTRTDDGVRLFVDGALVIDRWIDQAPTTHFGTKFLAAGSHDIRMDYYENGGGAAAGVEWARVGGGTTCPSAPLATPTDRWKLEIFNNRNLVSSSVEQRYEAPGAGGFNFDWRDGAASRCTGNDNFSIQMTRRFWVDSAGTYRFTSRTDDGVRVWVDHLNLIIDRWRDQSPTSWVGETELAAGWHDLRMDYYENQGGALASLTWQKLTGSPPPPSPPTGLEWDERLTTLGLYVEPADVGPGSGYWKLIRARFESDGEILPPPGGGSESRGTHYIYYKVLDDTGDPIELQRVFAAWPTGNPTNQVEHFTKGGGIDDFWGVFPMSGGWCPFYPQGGRGPFGARVGDAPADEVWGMGMPCNRHVSYRLTWKWTIR